MANGRAKAAARPAAGAKPIKASKLKSCQQSAQNELGRRQLRQALVLEIRQKAQARWGNKVGGAARHVTSTMATVPDHERAGYPLIVGKVKPEDWKTVDGMPMAVDLHRMSWLPDDWGQAVKVTKPVATSRPGAHGAFVIFIDGNGVVQYHKKHIEKFLGRKLTAADGFNGMMRRTSSQIKQTDEKSFFNMLSSKEKKHLPRADAFHFCVVSARRAQKEDGLKGIAQVEAQFRSAGVRPTWYVDKESLQDYRNLGLTAKVGGKLTQARNLCLEDAKKKGKACVQVSDDIARWEYYEGERAASRDLDALNAAHAAAKVHVVSPVAAARFMLAKLRSSGDSKSQPQLAGVYPLGSCSRAFAGDELCRYGFVIGDFFVVDKSPVRFDTEMKLKEDYDFSCSHMAKHGSLLRFNRLVIHAKHYSNSGGAVSERNSAEEQRNIGILKRRWPGVFSDNTTRKNEVILRWKGARSDGDAEGAAPTKGAAATKAASAKPATTLSSGRVGYRPLRGSKPVKKGLSGLKPTATIVRGGRTPGKPYLRARIHKALGRRVGDVLGALVFKDRGGVQRRYGAADLRYDIKTNLLALCN